MSFVNKAPDHPSPPKFAGIWRYLDSRIATRFKGRTEESNVSLNNPMLMYSKKDQIKRKLFQPDAQLEEPLGQFLKLSAAKVQGNFFREMLVTE